jgi:hypothetical protein
VRKRALDEKLYNFIKKIYDLAFFFMNKKRRALRFMKNMCDVVWKYDQIYYFAQHKILNDYNKEVLEKYGDRLVLKNSIVTVGNRKFDENLLKNYKKFVEGFDKFEKLNTKTVLNKKDPFYYTNYNQFNFSNNFIEIVDSPSKISILKGYKKMNFLQSKGRLPENISLFKSCPKGEKKKVIL